MTLLFYLPRNIYMASFLLSIVCFITMWNRPTNPKLHQMLSCGQNKYNTPEYRPPTCQSMTTNITLMDTRRMHTPSPNVHGAIVILINPNWPSQVVDTMQSIRLHFQSRGYPLYPIMIFYENGSIPENLQNRIRNISSAPVHFEMADWSNPHSRCIGKWGNKGLWKKNQSGGSGYKKVPIIIFV